MTLPDLEAIAERLANGESLEAAIRALQPDGRTELLKRCAALRHFDAALVDVLCAAPPAITDVSFEDLVRSGALEPVPGRDGTYRLPAPERQEYYARWWGDERAAVIPPELRTLSRRVLDHLEPRGDAEVEGLYHQLIVEPGKALERFRAAFDAAEQAFDLARCQDLVDALVERLALLGADGAAVCNAYQRRLRARAMWMRDFRRSARFLLPADSAVATEALLGDTTVRLLAVSSDGGMGKSSYLRWLISRACVPAGHACARIDFDAIDPLRACQEPWLLLLEAARQLDQQLVDAPFHELLAQYPRQLERLRRRATTIDSLGPAAAADVRERFGAALAELDPGQRVLIAVDTLEVALLLGGAEREQSEIVPVLAQLSELLAVAPALRVVLTARDDLTTAVGGFDELFPAAKALRLQPFSDEEARLYLRHYRGIERPELLERIVRSAAGVPFKLELIADVAVERPDLDPAELDDYVDADMAYLMDRIVARLDPALNRFLLFGVATRTLERGFADAVIAPLLGEPDTDRLWHDLKRYAGSASWLALDPVEVDAVRFHPSVLAPMRELLRNLPAQHDELHRRAAAWYEDRAATDPANATRWLCEAVYHRFQLEGPDARRSWERRLRDARVERRPDRRRALAAEVLGEEYVTGCGPRPWRDGRPLLSPEALLRARWELAFSAVMLAHPDCPERREGQALEAKRALKDLEHLQRTSAGKPLAPGLMALVRGGLALVEGDLDAAQPEVETALQDRLAREDRLWLWLAYAGAVSARGDRRAAAHFRTALRIAERGSNRRSDVPAVYLRLALHHADHDHLDRALAACEAGAAVAVGRQAIELALVRAQIERRHGAPTTAIASLPDVRDEEADVQARREIEHVRALLAAGHPLDALALAERTSARFGTVLKSAGDRQLAVAAEGRELRGTVRAALLDAEGAVSDFEESAARWSRLGRTDGVCRNWVRGAALHLRGLGNLHEAGVRLDQARRTRVERGQDAWTRCTLVGADLLHRSGESDRAARVVSDAMDALRRANRPPRAFVATALQGLAVTEGRAQDPFLHQLCGALSRVTPATARLALLDGLEQCSPLTGDARLRVRLRRLVPSPVSDAGRYAGFAEQDLVRLALRDAELDRVIGKVERARATLQHAWRDLAPDPSRATLHALVRAAVRSGAEALMQELAQRELSVIVPGEGAAPVRDGAALVLASTMLEDAPIRRQLLDVASAVLEDLGAAAGAWPARLLELRAREREAVDGGEARDLRRRAAELYEALGDDRRRDALLRAEGPVHVPVDEHEVRVTIRLAEDGLRVLRRRPDGTEGRLADCAASTAVRRLAQAPTPAHLAAALLKRADGLSADLAALLRPAAGTPDDPGTLDLGLRLKEPVLRALPWELAAPALDAAGLRFFRRSPRTRGEPADIRGVQGALNRLGRLRLAPDGNLGPETRAALAAFQERHGLRADGVPDAVTVQRLQAELVGGARPLVAIVRPSRRAEERAVRGSRQGGVPVDWLYERAGFRTLVLDAPSGDDLTAALRRRPVAILHLNAGLVDHHGSPAIDLLSSPGARGAGRITGTALDRAIPRNVPSPLVVLDVPAPKSRREAVAQLLLRNVFAAELAALGNARAIVGTGLARYDRQERLYDALIEALRSGADVYATVRAVRALAGPSLQPRLDDDAIAFTATTLFARRPTVRFPAPR